ncbi:MAG: twin-arginine translocase TatA/TatE family subunit, partial [Anaerolineae bacterium]|nr:twin-arginine translocase TatA/TatE family subunit [Anaerolineae bacterium]
LLILFIVMLLFGVGRISKVGSELGSAVANFRKGLNDGKPATPTEEKEKNG